jgi:hypothetical protein
VANFELKNFAKPDDVLEFPFGRGEIVDIGGGQVLHMTLQPGWRWSEHVKPAAGTELCQAAGDVNWLPPGHDAWVVGDEPVEAIDWGGAHVWGRPAE